MSGFDCIIDNRDASAPANHLIGLNHNKLDLP